MKMRFALRMFFLIALPAVVVFCGFGYVEASGHPDVDTRQIGYGLIGIAAICGLTWVWNAELSDSAEEDQRGR